MAIQTIGVLGAGQMGGGIAQVAAAAGYDVAPRRRVARARAEGPRQDRRDPRQAGREGQDERGRRRTRSSRASRPSPSPPTSRDCDLVIEAATENVELKLKLFRSATTRCAPGAILASNTSSISLTKLAGVDEAPRARHRHALHEPAAADEARRDRARRADERRDVRRREARRREDGQDGRRRARTRPASS